jgi:anti-anti-sigma factor
MRTLAIGHNLLIIKLLLDLWRERWGLTTILESERPKTKGGQDANHIAGNRGGAGFEIHGSVTLQRALIPYTSGMSDALFSYTTSPGAKDDTTVMKISGPLTLASIFGFQNEFRALKPPVLIVDLSDCPYMDSAGLGLLMNQFVSAQGGQRHFLLVAVNERIESLFELTHVSGVLKKFPTVEAAEASVS